MLFNNHYKSKYDISFLCLIIICILFISCASNEYEFGVESDGGIGSVSLLTTLPDEMSDIITNDFSGLELVKSLISRDSKTSRFLGARSLYIGSVITLISALFSISYIYLSLYENINSSNRFIIRYIHNLDGMKP